MIIEWSVNSFDARAWTYFPIEELISKLIGDITNRYLYLLQASGNILINWLSEIFNYKSKIKLKIQRKWVLSCGTNALELITSYIYSSYWETITARRDLWQLLLWTVEEWVGYFHSNQESVIYCVSLSQKFQIIKSNSNLRYKLFCQLAVLSAQRIVHIRSTESWIDIF